MGNNAIIFIIFIIIIIIIVIIIIINIIKPSKKILAITQKIAN